MPLPKKAVSQPRCHGCRGGAARTRPGNRVLWSGTVVWRWHCGLAFSAVSELCVIGDGSWCLSLLRRTSPWLGWRCRLNSRLLPEVCQDQVGGGLRRLGQRRLLLVPSRHARRANAPRDGCRRSSAQRAESAGAIGERRLWSYGGSSPGVSFVVLSIMRLDFCWRLERRCTGS